MTKKEKEEEEEETKIRTMSLEELIIWTHKLMLPYDKDAKPIGAPQPIDSLVKDCVRLRASITTVDNILNKKQKNTALFQSYPIGITYSVGLKLRKLFDTQSNAVSLFRIWNAWDNVNTLGNAELVKFSSNEEAEYIWKVLKKPNESDYKAYGYLQRVIAHNQLKQIKILWEDIDELLHFVVRTWSILVRATNSSFFEGPFAEWDSENKDIETLLSNEQIEAMKPIWNEYCKTAKDWITKPVICTP